MGLYMWRVDEVVVENWERLKALAAWSGYVT